MCTCSSYAFNLLFVFFHPNVNKNTYITGGKTIRDENANGYQIGFASCMIYVGTSYLHIAYCRYTMKHRKASLAGLPPEMLKEITKVGRASYERNSFSHCWNIGMNCQIIFELKMNQRPLLFIY